LQCLLTSVAIPHVPEPAVDHLRGEPRPGRCPPSWRPSLWRWAQAAFTNVNVVVGVW